MGTGAPIRRCLLSHKCVNDGSKITIYVSKYFNKLFYNTLFLKLNKTIKK